MEFDFLSNFRKSWLRSDKLADRVRQRFMISAERLSALACQVDISDDADGFLFEFADYDSIRLQANRELRSLYSDTYRSIRLGCEKEWNEANKVIDSFIMETMGSASLKLAMEDNHYKRYFERNGKALDAFFARNGRHGGMSLSDKIWHYTGNFRREMEISLSVAMGRGVPASKVASDVKKYLNDTDMLFRRVRDEDGNLRLSKAAREYHPGAGVYRSSFQNAMRVARTETNMAYQSADHERWKNLDFVVGIEVRLSNNHTSRTPDGKVGDISDICDQLAGKYPKAFKFTAWHPNCRCHAVPILKTEEEMDYELENGRMVKSENEVEDIPDNFAKWMEDNSERIAMAEGRGTLPYFITDNKGLLKGM